jgi:hypothetical protein
MLPRIRVMYATALLTALALLGAHTRAQVVATSAPSTAVAAAPTPAR